MGMHMYDACNTYIAVGEAASVPQKRKAAVMLLLCLEICLGLPPVQLLAVQARRCPHFQVVLD